MRIEYEIPSNGNFVMQVNLIDCNLTSVLRDKIFDYMKNEKILLDYFKKVLPNAKVVKIVRNPPNESLWDREKIVVIRAF